MVTGGFFSALGAAVASADTSRTRNLVRSGSIWNPSMEIKKDERWWSLSEQRWICLSWSELFSTCRSEHPTKQWEQWVSSLNMMRISIQLFSLLYLSTSRQDTNGLSTSNRPPTGISLLASPNLPLTGSYLIVTAELKASS